MSRIQLRRGTAAQWTAANPVLAAGEPGFETDTGKEKIGNGSTAWSALTYTTDTILGGEIVATDPAYGAPFTRAALINALDAAEGRGLHTIVRLPAGTYDIGDGISMNGRSVVLQGAGAGTSDNTGAKSGTVLYATTQSGIALDWQGWVRPANWSGRVAIGGFVVKGSGVADPTKANVGMRVDYLNGVLFHDITLRDTGGPGLRITADTPGYACYFNDFERITILDPVSTNTNDVPFMESIEANGNRFVGIFIVSRVGGGVANIGASGAVVFTGSATYSSHDNLLDCWHVENVTVPTGGTIFAMSANNYMMRDFQFFDSKKVAGATGTSFVRFDTSIPAGQNFGGNMYSGAVPGKGTNANDIDMGVDIRQSGNAVRGSKGYKGTNVTLASGVARTVVELTGTYSTATDPGIIDNSGVTTNRLLDSSIGYERVPQSTPQVDTIVATGAGSWTKPIGARRIQVILQGGGGGGGSGRRGAVGSVRCGGGGGGGGRNLVLWLQPSDIGTTAAYVVGAGGGGASGASSDSADGAAGTAGSLTSFDSGKWIAIAGSAGFGGTATSGGGAGASAGANSGGAASTSGGAGSAGSVLVPMSAFGGGAGGGISSGNAAANGGTSWNRPEAANFSSLTVGTGGAAGGNGTSQGTQTGLPTSPLLPGGGGTGGGGSTSGTDAGGAGGNGIRGGGGGGGGASTNGAASGAGGSGGDGFIQIITYFS